jgi:hypothetical protein
MTCRTAAALVALCVCLSVHAEVNPILRLTDADVATYTETFLQSAHLPDEWADLTLLAADRPAVVVPRLLARIEWGRKNGVNAADIITLARVAAYAGEDKAVEGLTQLALADHDTFTPILLESLGYAFSRGTGFSMAMLASGRSASIDGALARWIATHVGQRRDAEQLLEAVALWRGEENAAEALAADPLFAELPTPARQLLDDAAAERAARRRSIAN